MIRRVLAFVLLVVAGFLVLRFGLGIDAFTASSAQGGAERPPEPAPGGGIALQSGQERGGVSFSMSGAVELQRTREVPLPDGSRLVLPTYRVRAKDSRPRPERDNLVELDEVTIEMFRLVEAVGAEPRAELAGELLARMVLVEIERDVQGRPSLQEDRDMDVTDARFRSLPSTGVAPMTLAVGRVRVRNTKDATSLTTAPREPFELTVGGDRPAVLVGAGLAATIPVEAGKSPLDLKVLADPVLTMDDGATELRARGELHFVEQPDQTSTFDLRDAVSMQSRLAGRTPIVASGDRLHGTLRRGRGQTGRPEAQWSGIVLTGTPARVDGGEFAIEGDRLDLLPGLGEGVRLLTATGNPARLALTPPGGRRSDLSAQHRIHVVPVAAVHDDLLAPLGFPRGHLGSRYAQLVVFEGATTVDLAQADGRIALSAAEGLRVLRSASPDGPTTMVGRGAVSATLAGDDLHLTGDDGFVLHEATSGTKREVRLALGTNSNPRARFDLRRGDDLRLAGTGRCQLTQSDDGPRSSGSVELHSPLQDAVVTLPQGTLRQVRQLTARTSDGALTGMRAVGDACELDATQPDGGRVHGTASTIQSDRQDEFVLSGVPARVERSGEGEVEGRRITIRREREGAWLRAEGDARLSAPLDRSVPGAVAADLRAATITAAPWRAAPAPLLWHAAALPAAARAVYAANWRQPTVHAVGSVDLQIPPAAGRTEHTEASGEELWLAVDANAAHGLLLGAPATVVVTQDGQRSTGTAPRVRFERRGERGTLSLLPSAARPATLALHDATGQRMTGLPAATVHTLTIDCTGPVEVEDRMVRFTDAVQVRGVDPAGVDAFGLRARRMHMTRDAAGTIQEIVADEDVVVTSPRLSGSGHKLTLQLRRTLCVFEHPRGDARITLDDGTSWRGNRVEVDYSSYTVRAWYGDIGSGDTR